MNFSLSLRQAWSRADSMLCVGLDPDPARIPVSLGRGPESFFTFCREIVDATAGYVCAFKPQIAYFSAARAERELERLIEHIHTHHPGIPVILDAKRGDIGSTAERYAVEAFERYGADAVTINPYMGFDSIEPWLAWEGRGVILLCRTSNPGGSDLQALDVGGEALYERVARLSAGPWNTNGQIGLVLGATFPAELARVRHLAGDLPMLVPGIGAQGGDVQATVAAGLASDGWGMIINSSRAILYASSGTEFARAAADTAQRTCNDIRDARVRALAGRT
jgi:orotidine-5'-phosphate decarboxylase